MKRISNGIYENINGGLDEKDVYKKLQGSLPPWV